MWYGPKRRHKRRQKTYFKESILPKLKDDSEWSPEESGGGCLKGKDQELCGWKMGVTPWGSLRFDPERQEFPHQEPAEGGS
jgi:hypothetical protein